MVKTKITAFLLILSIFTISCSAGCGTSEITPSPAPPKTLPSTWTPSEAEQISQTAEAIPPTIKPSQTPTATLSPTPVPSENWWALSLGIDRRIRIRYAEETTDGGILLWGQEKNQSGDVFRDLIIKLSATGHSDWEKTLSPSTARIHGLQSLEDGSVLIRGYNQRDERPDPFFLQLSENGQILSYAAYRNPYDSTERYYLRYYPEAIPGEIGYLKLSGDLPGKHHIHDYAAFPSGDVVLMGHFSGTITGAMGGTFGILSGLWAVRFDRENQVIWQRFYQTKAGPLFYGSILPDGSITMIKSGPNNLDSILKLDPDGYTEYWKHFSTNVLYGEQTGTADGGLIITGAFPYLLALRPDGEISWSVRFLEKEDTLTPLYAMETRNGDLIMAASTGDQGPIIARFNTSTPFQDCPLLSYEEDPPAEHFPLLPYNISGSIKAKPYTRVLEESDLIIAVEDLKSSWLEICRYRDPIQ